MKWGKISTHFLLPKTLRVISRRILKCTRLVNHQEIYYYLFIYLLLLTKCKGCMQSIYTGNGKGDMINKGMSKIYYHEICRHGHSTSLMIFRTQSETWYTRYHIPESIVSWSVWIDVCSLVEKIQQAHIRKADSEKAAAEIFHAQWTCRSEASQWD